MKRGRRDTLLTLLGGTFGPLAALVTAPVLAAGLGAAGRGEVAAATAPLLLAVSLASLGLPSAVNHWVARHSGHTRRVVGVSVAISCAAGLTLSLLLATTSHTLTGGRDGVADLIALAGLALVPNLVAALLQSVAAGRHAWACVTVERFLTNGLRLSAIAVAAATGTLTVELAVLVIAVTPILGAVVYLPLLGGTPSAPPEPARVSELLSYGGRVWAGALAGIVLTRIDQVLLLPIAGATALGVYVVAVSLSDLPLVVATAVREVAYSRQSAAEQHDALAIASRVATLVVLVACCAIAAVLPWAVPLLFGPEFASAVSVTMLLLVGCAVSVPGSLAGVALAAAGRPGARSASLAVAAACNVVLLVLLAGPFGAFGAAVATLTGTVVANGLNLVLAARLLGLRKRTLVGFRRSDFGVVLGPRTASR